jgi:hypothetical protein
MSTHHKCNLWFGEPDFDCRSHRACSVAKLKQCLCHRSLVAFRAVRGLLLCAKHLFVAASTVWLGLQVPWCQAVFALAFACYRCGASPPTIGTVERCRVARGRRAACASTVSTVERRGVAAGRGSTCTASIRSVEPGLLRQGGGAGQPKHEDRYHRSVHRFKSFATGQNRIASCSSSSYDLAAVKPGHRTTSRASHRIGLAGSYLSFPGLVSVERHPQDRIGGPPIGPDHRL